MTFNRRKLLGLFAATPLAAALPMVEKTEGTYVIACDPAFGENSENDRSATQMRYMGYGGGFYTVNE